MHAGLFIVGLVVGLLCSVFFVLGMRVRRNVDEVGTVGGKVRVNAPVLRTEADEAELEERIDARGK